MLFFLTTNHTTFAFPTKTAFKIKIEYHRQASRRQIYIEVEDLLIEIRTSSLPSEYGESIVMRILNPKA